MKNMTYVGLDAPKKTIAYCVKTRSGKLVKEGEILATRAELGAWATGLRRPWTGALEATLFTGWIHDFLAPRAAALKGAHPAMLKAIARPVRKRTTGWRRPGRLRAGVSRCAPCTNASRRAATRTGRPWPWPASLWPTCRRRTRASSLSSPAWLEPPRLRRGFGRRNILTVRG